LIGRAIMKLVAVHELKINDILEQDIENDYGVVVISGGTVVTEYLKLKIENLDIDFVYVKTHNVDEEEAETVFERKINAEFTNTIDSFKDIFMSAKFGQKIIVDEFKESVKPLVNDLMVNDNILGNLRKIKVNDTYTYKHSINVGLISAMIGKWLNYSETDLSDLVIAGMFHDIGKSKIPASILDKKEKLNYSEYEIIKAHVGFGYEILCESGDVSENIRLGVRDHHERYSGKGYQFGLNGDKIHEFGRIIAVADIFDAMTSDRSYKKKISPFKVAEYIRELSFSHLDPQITNLFLKNIASFYVGNIVQLNNGAKGEVILVNKSNYTKPLIKVESNYVDLSKDYTIEIVDILA